MMNNGDRLILWHIKSLGIICKAIHNELLDGKYFTDNFASQALSQSVMTCERSRLMQKSGLQLNPALSVNFLISRTVSFGRC